MSTPYAYLAWICGTCDGHLIEENEDRYDLRCETDGHTFRSSGSGYADYVPDEESE